MKTLLQASIVTMLLSMTQAANAEGDHQHAKDSKMSGMHGQMKEKMQGMEHGENCMGNDDCPMHDKMGDMQGMHESMHEQAHKDMDHNAADNDEHDDDDDHDHD